MPQGPNTIYLLKRGEYFQRVVNDVVQQTPDPIPLVYAPDGWRDLSLQNHRNFKYFSLDREVTIPLAFVEDGARILKHYLYRYGIEEVLKLIIGEQKLYFDDTHYGFYYSKLFEGEVKFSTFSHEGPRVSANVVEGGPVKLIRANENTTVEIPLDGDDVILVKMDGVTLHKSATFIVGSDFEIKKSVFGTQWFLPLSHINNNGVATGIIFTDQTIEAVENLPFNDKINSENKFLAGEDTNTHPILVTIKGKIRFKCTVNDPGLGFRARLLTSTMQLSDQNNYELFNVFHAVVGNTYEFDVDLSIPVQPGEKLHIEGIYTGGITGAIDIGIEFLEGSELSVAFSSRYRTTYIKAMRLSTLFKKIMETLSNGEYTIESDTLEEHRDIVVTCGDAIRGIDGAVIKTSLAACFQATNTVLGVGLGMIGNQLRLEKKADWVDYSDPIDLGEVSKLKVTPLAEYLHNGVKIGYNAQEYEDVDGRQEFNNTHEYRAPGTEPKTLELVSPYRADCYGIEYTRINLDGKTTTDDKADNDVFLLHVADEPIEENGQLVYELDRSLNPYATGLLEPDSVFNIWLSPKHCLLRNGDYIRSLFYKQDTQKLTFQTTEKNRELMVSPPGKTPVDEDADIEIAQLGERLFVPIAMEFTTQVPLNLFNILKQNPVKAFRFKYRGHTFTGIPVKIAIQPETNQAQQFQLLSSPENDLTVLEEVFT